MVTGGEAVSHDDVSIRSFLCNIYTHARSYTRAFSYDTAIAFIGGVAPQIPLKIVRNKRADFKEKSLASLGNQFSRSPGA
jgi:hypothetical protein